MFSRSGGNSVEAHLPSTIISQKDSEDTASCGNLSDSPTIANGDNVLSVGLDIFPVRYCLTLVLCFGDSKREMAPDNPFKTVSMPPYCLTFLPRYTYICG